MAELEEKPHHLDARQPPRRRGRPRRTEAAREKWIDAAWEMLCSGEIQDVRVELIAKRLGVTKGGFYWHFKDRSALVCALVDRWLASWSAPDHQITDPRERLWILMERAIRREQRAAGVAIRSWSHTNTAIAARIRLADAERFAWIRSNLEALGFMADQATMRAELILIFLSGEYIRHGGSDVESRVKSARVHHAFLTGAR